MQNQQNQYKKQSKSFDNLIKFINGSINIKQKVKNGLVSKIKEAQKCFIQFNQRNSKYINQVNKMNDSITNLSKFKAFDANPNEIQLFIDNANKVLNAIMIYTKFMNSQKNHEIKEIETLLFNIVFNPSEYSPFTQVYSVYEMHNKFLFNNNSFVNFKSSTGSGKTRCAPYFFSIKALLENMKYPFFIMTQPGSTIIKDKLADFKQHLGEHIHLVSKVPDMIELYKNADALTKPVVGLFSPYNVLKLLSSIDKNSVISRTRFCLDEIHERSVYTDVLISILSSAMKSQQHFDLQVLMMSATPDPRVLHCFGKVNEIEMPDTQLFPIDTIRKEVTSKNEVSKIAAEQAFECIKKMSRGEQQVGHIIIFTSGNARINEIDKYLSSTYESLKSKSTSAHEQFNIKMLNNIKLDKKFHSELNKIIKWNDDSLYVIPIKFAGFVSNEQKEIAKQVIKKHKNVIKIIMATNAIESSITIDELSVVIDTGLFNQPMYTPQTGITNLMEEPISIQSQAQRRGRVGRVRPGVSVQLSIKGLQFKQYLPPEIQTTDITSAILSLRKIGINLEEIDNLPDKIPSEILKKYMTELYLCDAIDHNSGKITDNGMRISMFESISPFLSSAIMRASSTYNQNGDFDYKLLEILGSLIVLIFNNTELISDVTSTMLQKNFNEDSDIITVLLTFLECAAEVKPKLWKTSSVNYGFNPKSFIQISSTVNNIATNLEITDTKEIFKSANELCRNIDLMKFIQEILNSVEMTKPEWVLIRESQFLTLETMIINPTIVYVGNNSLSFDGGAQSEILIRMRPGAKGFSSPGSAYIMSISHNESLQRNFGTYVHRNIKKDPIQENVENYSILKPKILVSDISLYNQEEFSSCLLSAILIDSQDKFHKFNALSHSGNESGKMLFYISQFNGEKENKSIITYAP